MKDSVQLIEAYFRSLHEIRQTGGGVKEESYYGSLENLLNGIGKSLKPQVRCIIQLINHGAGHPDGGLFTKEQWYQGNDEAPLLGQTPSRGVIEVKPTSDGTWIREFEKGMVVANPTGKESTIQFPTIYKNVSTGVEGSHFVVAPKDGGIFLQRTS
jgi:hypothetical protein